MRKIIVLSFISLDGIMQAPGSPDEDPSGGFKYGGWTAPYSDEVSGRLVGKQMEQADLLLGRRTFEIFEAYWPDRAENWPGINDVNKYVLSNTRESSSWNNAIFLSDLTDIERVKSSEGSDLKVWGSSELVHLLLKNDLVDELWLNMYPITLGNGKKLFEGGSIPAAFNLVESAVTPSGVFIANYVRAGDVKTGTVGA